MTGGTWRRTRKPPLGVVSTLLLAMALVATSACLTPKGYRLATGEDFLFDALRCNEARVLGRYSGRTFCRSKPTAGWANGYRPVNIWYCKR